MEEIFKVQSEFFPAMAKFIKAPSHQQELEESSFELHLSKDSWKTLEEVDDDVVMAESKATRHH